MHTLLAENVSNVRKLKKQPILISAQLLEYNNIKVITFICNGFELKLENNEHYFSPIIIGMRTINKQ